MERIADRFSEANSPLGCDGSGVGSTSGYSKGRDTQLFVLPVVHRLSPLGLRSTSSVFETDRTVTGGFGAFSAPA